jgi:hypothetical protein
MKIFCLLSAIILFGCNPEQLEKSEKTEGLNDKETTDTTGNDSGKINLDSTFSNESFRNVTVKKLEQNRFYISGEAKVFEATINFVVETDNKILIENFTTAEIGAPEWGKFHFTAEIDSKDFSKKLKLILFESSAEDGSRLHQLIIPLN